LPVLDDLMQQDFLFPRRLYPAGNFGESGPACRQVATLSSDYLVDVFAADVADGDRLKDAMTLDRGDQFRLGVGIEPLPGLEGIGPDAGDFDERGAGKAFASLDRPGTRRRVMVKRQVRRGCERAFRGPERGIDDSG